MRIELAKDRGAILSRAKGLRGKELLSAPGRAVILTGANGSGKSALINALAFCSGLRSRYASSRTKGGGEFFPGLFAGEGKEPYKGVRVTDDSGREAEFDLVLRFRGEGARTLPLAMDAAEDMDMLLTARASHGEASSYRLGKALKEADRFLGEEDGGLLLLLDEPEAGTGPDVWHNLGDSVLWWCRRAGRVERLMIVVATQNPVLVVAGEIAKAGRIDLGGWIGDEDPFAHWGLKVREMLKEIGGACVLSGRGG